MLDKAGFFGPRSKYNYSVAFTIASHAAPFRKTSAGSCTPKRQAGPVASTQRQVAQPPLSTPECQAAERSGRASPPRSYTPQTRDPSEILIHKFKAQMRMLR